MHEVSLPTSVERSTGAALQLTLSMSLADSVVEVTEEAHMLQKFEAEATANRGLGICLLCSRNYRVSHPLSPE